MSLPGGVAADRLPVADRAQIRRGAWQLVREDRRALLLMVGLYCAAAAAALPGPWLIGVIVNQVRAGASISTVDMLALAIVGAVASQLLLERSAAYAGHRFGERALARLREQFVDRSVALPLSTVERAGSGDLMTRSTSGVATVGPVVRDAAPEIFLACVQVVFIVAALFLLHPVLGACALVALPLLWPLLRWYLRRAPAAYLAEGAADTEVSEELAATADGARTAEALGLEQRRVAVGDATVRTGVATRQRTLFLRSGFFLGLDVASLLPLVAVLLVGGWLFLSGWVSLGAAVAGVLYLQRLVEPLYTVLTWLEQLQRGIAAFARLEGVAQVAPDRTETDARPVDNRLSVRDVSYAYRPGHHVLHGVDLEVRPGERLAVVGPSGAGKSTLGRMLAGVDAPGAGRVTVGGVPVVALPLPELRRRVMLVTQEHHAFIGTLRENLSLADLEADDNALRRAMTAVGARWLDNLPDGLDTALGAGGAVLDPGQIQQLALARLILADPHTVVLDEATSSLNPATARQAERALAAALSGRTVIAISHRLHTAHDADRIVVVEDGRITEVGSHEELLAGGGSYAALWRTWHGHHPG